MTATPDKYQTPYVSQMLQEPDRVYDDCAAATGLMLGGDWTMGEILERPDGKERDLPTLRNAVRRRIGDTDGGLTLHDVNDILHELDPDIADLPRYPGQKAKPGQSTAGADLRVAWDQFKGFLQNGYSAALCGRTASGVGHVVHVTDGDKDGATLRDPLTRNKPGWKGERVKWSDLRAFTERGPDRYGSPTMIACALVKVGAETQAARVQRASVAKLSKVRSALEKEQDRSAGLTVQVGALNAQVKTLAARVKELEDEPTDCTAAVTAERSRVLDAVSDGVDELVTRLRA